MDASKKKKRIRPVRRNNIELHSINDLIVLSQTGVQYDHINTEMLWRITPQLVEINQMIGMEELKTSLFYQIIYYLQDLSIGNSKDYLHTVILGSPGTGKCLAKDTFVMMYDGTFKKVQDIKVNDKIMGDDSTSRTILNTCQGVDDMYRIHTPTFSYVVNQEHQLSLIYDNDIFCERTLKEFLYLDQSRYRGYKKAYQVQPVLELTIDAYLWGYVYCSSKPSGDEHQRILHITCERIQSYFESFSIIHPFSLNQFFLVDMNYFKGYSIDQMLSCSKEDRLYILAGMADALGRYDKYSNCLRLIVEESLFIITRLCDSLALKYSFDRHELNYTLTNEPISIQYYTLEIYNAHHIPCFSFDYDYTLQTSLSISFPIRIESIGEGDYYGFECDGNGRFLLKDGTVTHNTTIARIIGEMYKNMGILSPEGTFKIAKREDFIAEYLGQTAIKTKKLLDKCKGGVLFIDEVYALGPGKQDADSFSKEAIDTLNVFLSENSHMFCCIIAGYEEDVKNCFFSINQGLERRFQWVHRIGKYSTDNLVDIFFKLIEESCWYYDIERNVVSNIINKYPHLFESFGGSMENLFTKCKMAHAKRLINHSGSKKHQLINNDLLEAIELLKPNQMFEKKQESTTYLSMYV